MGYWRDPARKDWVYRFQFQGKNFGGRGFKTKAAARIARAEHKKRLESDLTQATAAIGFKELAYGYIDDCRRRFTKKTWKAKEYTYFLFLKHHGDMPITHVTPRHLDDFLKTRPTNCNFNAHRKQLHALFTFAKRKLKIIDYNPCWDVDPMPYTAPRKRIPTEAQILEIIMAADPEIERPLLLTVLLTLARISEALRLTWKDINFEKRTVTLWTRKRKSGSYEADPVPMNADLYDVLWRLWKKRTQNKWVFFNAKTGTRYRTRKRFMRGLCKRAGIEPHFGFHALRHFMASYLADKKKRSTKTLQKLLRHKEQRTTEIYLHSVDESIREAMNEIEGDFLVSGVGVGSDRKEATKATPGANAIE